MAKAFLFLFYILQVLALYLQGCIDSGRKPIPPLTYLHDMMLKKRREEKRREEKRREEKRREEKRREEKRREEKRREE
jgi:hypothetical protein